MRIPIKKLNDLAKIPTIESTYAAGVDLYAATDSDIEIRPGQVVKIDTGLSMAIPERYFGAIFARSGLATKQGLRPANCVGVIDSDYRGPVMVALYNDSDEVQIIPAGSRIAQIIILPCQYYEFYEMEELSQTERGAGGFGSTGIN